MTTIHFEALQVEIDDLRISPLNVRREVDDVSELAESIREQGVLEPLVVRRTSDGKFEVIMGSRRLTASQQVGLDLVPVVVQDISDADAVLRSLAENIQRQNLSLEERVQAYQTLQQLEPERFASSRGLARAIGRGRSNIDNDFEAYEALTRLRPRGVSVRQSTSPQSSERRSGDVIPTAHAAMIQQAMSAVSARLPQESLDDTYEELARAVAPLEQDRARRVLEYFTMYPERPVSEAVSMALATVQRQVTLPAETARKLEELASSSGAPDWGTVLADLVEDQTSENPTMPASDVTEKDIEAQEGVPRSATEEEQSIQSMFDPVEGDESSNFGLDSGDDTFTPRSHAGLSGQPEDPTQVSETLSEPDALARPIPVTEPSIQEQFGGKTLWNLEHASINADFFTVGYRQKTITQFIEILQTAGVLKLVDIRNNPHSQYRPEFNQQRLREELAKHEIEYTHRGELGVPSSIRTPVEAQTDRSQVWDWYRENVITHIRAGDVEELIGESESRVAFMCVEINPRDCHRHILVEELETHGYTCFDL